MANHKSAKKRIRQGAKRRLLNRYKKTTLRTTIKRYTLTTDKAAAEEMLPKVVSMIDKVAKVNIIHKNKASRMKSQIYKHLSSL